MENVYPLNPKQLGTYQKRPQPANHFTQSAGKDLITPQTWRKTGKREKCGLGAQRTRVMAMVFGENALVAAFGTGAGLGAALLASKALASFLYGTSPRDPWVLVGSVAALTVIASAASLLPALRAARIEPMAAIRCE